VKSLISFTSFLIAGLASGANVSVQEPFILADRASQTYYLFTAASTLGSPGGVEMYKSPDLISWEGPQTVFTVPDAGWADPAQGVHRPQVVDYRGRYFLFVTMQNTGEVIKQPPDAWRATFRRGTQVFVGESPGGPFRPVSEAPGAPFSPADSMAQDGTLFVEGAIPYMVYAHSWEQTIDGLMEAVELAADLSQPASEPFYLFKGSDGLLLKDPLLASRAPRYYPVAGPQMFRTRSGRLLMLWSGYREGVSVQAIAYSLSDELRGPWRQAKPILGDDRGQGSLFETFDDRLMLVLGHQGAERPRLEMYELEDRGDTLRIVRPFVPGGIPTGDSP